MENIFRKAEKRRRIDAYHIESEKEKWIKKGWKFVKSEVDKNDPRRTFLYFEKLKPVIF